MNDHNPIVTNSIGILFCWVGGVSLSGISTAIAHPASGIVADDKGNVYFLGAGLSRIGPGGAVTRVRPTYNGRPVTADHRLAIDRRSGDLYFRASCGIVHIRFRKRRLWRVKLRKYRTLPLRLESRLLPTVTYSATPLAVNSKGTVFVTQMESGRRVTGAGYQIIAVGTNGKTRFVAGSERGHRDGKGFKARFEHFYDSDMAVGPDDSLYLTDGGTSVRRVDKSGNVETLAGSLKKGSLDGKGAKATFRRIVGIDVDKNGNAYVADSESCRIRKVTSKGVVTTVAGNGKQTFVDGPALKASFIRPVGIAVGTRGDIYILDSALVAQRHTRISARVRKLTANGRVQTIAVIRDGRAFAAK